MIAELIKRKYDSDPVKSWKMKQNKENALVRTLSRIKRVFYELTRSIA
jgi:hypothetical protein